MILILLHQVAPNHLASTCGIWLTIFPSISQLAGTFMAVPNVVSSTMLQNSRNAEKKKGEKRTEKLRAMFVSVVLHKVSSKVLSCRKLCPVVCQWGRMGCSAAVRWYTCVHQFLQVAVRPVMHFATSQSTLNEWFLHETMEYLHDVQVGSTSFFPVFREPLNVTA